MAIPVEQILLVDKEGQAIKIDELVERLRIEENHRILADDEIGLVVYVSDLEIYKLTPMDSGDCFASKVKEISRPRFSTQVLRKQIGATVLSVTSDAVFVVRDNQTFKKVRAEKLEPGMILASGEKVYK